MTYYKLSLKLFISALLLGCLFKMPYGYYQFVRIATCIGFIALAYIEYESKIILTALLSALAAILFNPIAKIYFKKDTWQTIDEVIAIALAVWIITDLIHLYNEKRGKEKEG
jgi:glucose-6-phosphate-specific signal transduction histidine kinase